MVNAVTQGSQTTPLHLAAALGHEQIVNILLSAPGKLRRMPIFLPLKCLFSLKFILF
jgi:ankyrin repeat protein